MSPPKDDDHDTDTEGEGVPDALSVHLDRGWDLLKENDLDGAPLVMPRPGFLDIGEWDPDGLPTFHEVAGVNVYGPDNGLTYWYRVASRDSLDRAVAFDEHASAAVVDHHLRHGRVNEQVLDGFQERQDPIEAAHSTPRSTWSK
jgi:hypothetical protein